MIFTEDGHWAISESTDIPADFFAPPSGCLRCGTRVYTGFERKLHDDFHARVEPAVDA